MGACPVGGERGTQIAQMRAIHASVAANKPAKHSNNTTNRKAARIDTIARVARAHSLVKVVAAAMEKI